MEIGTVEVCCASASFGSLPHLPEPCDPHAQDLKSPNILIDNQWRIKIGDFGLSRLLKGGKKFDTANVESGTPEWMAPEVLRTEGGSDKSDVSCRQHSTAWSKCKIKRC